MKKTLIFLLLALTASLLVAQGPGSLSRLSLDPNLGPFYHGVASGDPLSDAVIIWTRVTTQDAGPITVSWKMATDTLFNNIVQSGTATTSAARDYTVKADVTGLQPYTYYYYQFEYGGRKSLIGRTKTAPTGDATHLRFAVASCADYESGYYNAYEHITYRNDIDAVLYLGDYIYEYEVGHLPGADPSRGLEPEHEIITLSDYRARYSHYHLDPQLRGLHQQYPFITTWDDHESANNSWYGGAENHDPNTEGDWFVRKANSKKAYFEWLPVRESSIDSTRIYRKFNYSDLADIIVLDTRLEGRDEQDGTNNNDPNRTILGHDQYDWLVTNVHDSTAQWKIIAQQVMMAPLSLGALTFNADSWDGYPAERTRLFNEIIDNDVRNFVVVTGDIHTSWANELPGPNYNSSTGAGSAGVEFITTSITTANADVVGIPLDPSLLIPHVKFADLIHHGYLILDIDTNRAQSDWYFVNTLDQRDPRASLASSWYVNNNERTLNEAQAAAPGLATVAPLAPLTVDNPPVGINAHANQLIIVGSYPNPFYDNMVIQYFSKQARDVDIQIIDMNGKIVAERSLQPQPGVNYTQLNGGSLSPGNYILRLKSDSGAFERQIVKVR